MINLPEYLEYFLLTKELILPIKPFQNIWILLAKDTILDILKEKLRKKLFNKIISEKEFS